MDSRWLRARAYLHYLRRPLRSFAIPFSLLLVLLIAGGVAFNQLYQKEPMSFGKALYITYSLVFMEHVVPFPEHWLLRTYYVVLPPLGLAVFLDGIVRFSYYILRRNEDSDEWRLALAQTLSNHVILCGLGKVGLRTLENLLLLGERVCVLEKDPNCPNRSFAMARSVPVIIGTGREEGVFAKLNAVKAKSIVAATDDDLANLELVLDARKVNPAIRVVLRLFDQELAQKLRESFNIAHAFSTSALAGPVLATSSSDRAILNAFYVGDRLLLVASLEINEDSELVETSLQSLETDYDAVVLAHERDSEVRFRPPRARKLAAGDRVTVQLEPAELRAMHESNHDAKPY